MISLAGMMSANRDALLCDLAETYGIYDLKALPARTLATLSVGLREDSRIMMHLRGERVSKTDMMLAAIVDRLSMIVWLHSEDAKTGINRPAMLVDRLLEKKNENAIQSFESPVAFEEAWENITGVKHG